MAKTMLSGKSEQAIIELDGKYRRIAIHPIHGEDGSVRGAVHIIRDIDDAKRKESSLRESEKKYRELVETMSDVVFTLDFDGNAIDISPSMEKILGLRTQEIMGSHFSKFVHPDDIKRAEEEFLRAIQGVGHPIEIRLMGRDGAPRWVRINALLTFHDDEPDNLLCVLSDINEKRLAEESLVRRTKDAEEARVKARAYFDFLAHDIANLLSPVLAYAELLRIDENTPEQCKVKAAKIVDQARRASSFILSLRKLEDMDLSRKEQTEECDLATVMDEAVSRVTAEFEDKEISATVVHPQEQITFIGGKLLESAILGILENAISEADRDRVAVEVKANVTGEKNHRSLNLEVADDGPGMSEDVKDSFLTSEDPRKRFEKGTSRGVASTLLVSSAMVYSLGGELRVENRDSVGASKGNRISIVFPQERFVEA